jgi:hypothetical protein
MSIHAERILGLQRMDVGTQVADDGEMISTVTLGSDVSICLCCT